MFEALEKIGMAKKFIIMAKLFENAKVSMCVSSSIIVLFNIERGVRQGCMFSLHIHFHWKSVQFHV
jgi:hypothetical protein